MLACQFRTARPLPAAMNKRTAGGPANSIPPSAKIERQAAPVAAELMRLPAAWTAMGALSPARVAIRGPATMLRSVIEATPARRGARASHDDIRGRYVPRDRGQIRRHGMHFEGGEQPPVRAEEWKLRLLRHSKVPCTRPTRCRSRSDLRAEAGHDGSGRP